MRCMNRVRHVTGALALVAILFTQVSMPVSAQEATTFTSAVVTKSFFDTTLKHNIPNLQVTRNGVTHSVNFLDHYSSTGGLTRWGFPTSEVVEEETGNLTQYYQRGVVDWHWRPDLGRYEMERRLAWDFFGGGSGGSVDLGVELGRTNPHPGEVVGPWGHKVSDFSIRGIYTGFKSFYESLGGVNAFGFPKTDARIDTNASGTLHIQSASPGFIRQYFQAAVLEFHREDPEPVKLQLLGDSLRNLNYPNNSWRTYAAFNAVSALTQGQQYTVPRVVRGHTSVGRPVVVVPTATPRPGTPVAPAATPIPGATPVPTVTPVPAPVVPAGTSVWFGTAEKGLSHFDGTNWRTYRTFKDPILPDDAINDIFIASDGSKWFATQNGLARLHGTTLSQYTTTSPGFAGNEITSVHVLGNLVWIGTDGDGASFGRISGNTIRWEQLDRDNSNIPSDVVRDVLIINEHLNRVWLATDNGAAIFNNGIWTIFRNIDTTSLAAESGNVWVGTNGHGVRVYDGVTWTDYTTTNSAIASDTIRRITKGPDGRVWLATQNGVSVYNGANWVKYNSFASGITSNDVYDIAIDAAGQVWVATDAGASVLLTSGIWQPYQTANSDIHDDSIRAVAVE